MVSMVRFRDAVQGVRGVLGVSAALLGAALLVSPSPAVAHAEKLSVTLTDGARVDVMPGSFDVGYDGPVVVSGPVSLQSVSAFFEVPFVLPEPGVLSFALPDVGEGWFRLRWQVVAEDGHLMPGDVTFLVWSAGSDAPPRPVLELPVLRSSSPSDGAALLPGDGTLGLVFDRVSPGLELLVTVVPDGGAALELGPFLLEREVEVGLPELGPGRHRFGWAVSGGGVVVAAGSLAFEGAGRDPEARDVPVVQGPDTAPTVVGVSPAAEGRLLPVVPAVLLVLALGVAAFVALRWRSRA